MPSNETRARRFVAGMLDEKRVPEDLVEVIVRKLGLLALRGVVLNTPVRTGRARGNWQVTLGDPAEGDLERTDRSGGPTIASGASVIGGYRGFGKVSLTNNLPYIIPLEDGSSKRAPAGMVAITFERLATE